MVKALLWVLLLWMCTDAAVSSRDAAAILVLGVRGSEYRLNKLKKGSGWVLSSVRLDLEKLRPPPAMWITTNNGYDFAVSRDGREAMLVLYSQTGNRTSHPLLVAAEISTGHTRLVAELPYFNYPHIQACPMKVAVDENGDVLVGSLHYLQPSNMEGPTQFGFVRANPSNGATVILPPLTTMDVSTNSGSMLLSEQGAFGPGGIYCDNWYELSQPRKFHRLVCFDIHSGQVVANSSNHEQLYDFAHDTTTGTFIGLALCCDDGSSDCPPECKGHNNQRTLASWTAIGSAPPRIKALLNVTQLGSTYVTLGRALDSTSRAFTYVSVHVRNGVVNGYELVDLDVDTGSITGRTNYTDVVALGTLFRFAYMP